MITSNQEVMDKLLKEAKLTTIVPPRTGGQVVSMMPNPIIQLEQEEVEFKVQIGYFRQARKNADLAKILLELYLEKIIK